MDPDPGSLTAQTQESLLPASLEFFLEADLSTYLLLGLAWGVLLLIAGATRILRTLNTSLYDSFRERQERSAQRILIFFENRDSLRLSLYLIQSLLIVAVSILGMVGFGKVTIFLSSLSAVQLILSFLFTGALLLTALYAIPQWLEARFSVAYLGFLSPLLRIIDIISAPLTRPLALLLRKSIRYGQIAPHMHSAESLKAMADLGEAHGHIEEEERELIHSIFEYGDTTVKEVMISRLDINSISTETPLQEALAIIQESGHSRLPLHDGHLDAILGIIYAKDLLPYLGSLDGSTIPDWKSIARPALFVSEGKLLDDFLAELREQKTHLAIVVDKYGGTAGLATMEDVLEEIVGEILDEYDVNEEAWHTQIAPDIYDVDARMDLDDLNDLLKIELETEKFDFDTLGGLIFHQKGDIPIIGDVIDYGPLSMRIESLENHRIGRVRIRVAPRQEAAASTSTP